MFVACPHCQFLVARDPQAHTLPANCTRCGKPLPVEDAVAQTPSPSLATFLHPAPSPGNEAVTNATQAEATPVDTREDSANDTAADDVDPDASAAEPVSETIETVEVIEAHASAEPDGMIDTVEATTTTTDDVAASPDTERDAALSAQADDAPHSEVPIDASQVAAVVDAKPKARGPTGPRFLQRARTTPVHTKQARIQWFALIALSLLLCAQVVLADRARLATQAGWRPIVVALCGVFRCDVPTWREPAAFTMLSRDVRPIIGSPGALQAQATFRNEARWAQAWPVILLTLKDADGRTLGARALQPDDYLPQGEASPSIGPGQSAQMAVRVKEPSANVVAFSFDFR